MILPESWIQTTVANVVSDIQPGFAQAPGDESEGTTPQIRTHNVSPEGKITLDGIKHITASDKELLRYSLKSGDVIFNNTNSDEWVGKTALFNQEGEYVFSNHMTRLRVHSDVVLPEFLAGYLHLLWGSGYSKTRAKQWVSQSGIDSSVLAQFKIPVPILSEQEKIVALIKEVNEIDILGNQTRKQLASLTKQCFIEKFGHPAENPYGFEAMTFHKFGSLDRGVSKHRPRDAENLFGGPYPFIQTGDVSNAGDWITTYNSTYSDAGLAQSKLWPAGTLCITIAANIARAAILEFDACFPDSVVGFLPKDGVTSEYILYCLRFYQEYFEHRAPKSAQMNINLDTLRRLRIPNPPTHLQQEFSAFVKEVRILHAKVDEQIQLRSQLKDALTISAFSGDLTESWRSSNIDLLSKEIKERDALLRERGTKLTKPVSEAKPIAPKAEVTPPSRHWLNNELSEFQRRLLAAFQAYVVNNNGQALLTEDQERFAEFCTSDEVTEQLQAFGNNLNNRIGRSLSQLAALGLIAKITLPKLNQESGEREYVKAFRPLREEEFTRLSDIAGLRKALSIEELHKYFYVDLDYETLTNAGAAGMFQVISIKDESDQDVTSHIDQGQHYNSLDELKRDLASTLKLKPSQIQLEVE